MNHSLLCAAGLVTSSVALLFVEPRVAMAQDPGATVNITSRQGLFTVLVPLDGPAHDSIRTRALRDSATTLSLLASASSLTPRIPGASAGFAARVILPETRLAYNANLPFSANDGALWAGRGWNADVVFGGEIHWRRLRLLLLPEATYSANAPYDTAVPALFPPRPGSRSLWSSPFHTRAQSIDLPIRFGDHALRAIGPGQSTLAVDVGLVELGAATENDWWGPGIRNALILSNNAAGFPHLFVRTAHPLSTPAGKVEARWMTGGLSESAFFDTLSANDLRSIAVLGVTVEPRGTSGLTVGAARSVYAPAPGWGAALVRFADVFRDVGHPDAVPYSDTSMAPGPDQLFSLFGRWVFPRNGLEAYAEWARAEFPVSLRDFLVQPNHTQAYTVGLQWLSDSSSRTHGRLRAQGEATFAQQSTTYRFRPLGSWYTSRAVEQGYTNRGQTIGAAIGPGSSSQWIALDHLASEWSAGLYVNRIRWLEDAHSQTFIGLPSGNGWCEHDVSMLGGVRGEIATRAGRISMDYATGWRRNVFFNRQPDACPFNGFGDDVRVHQLRFAISPAISARP
jgi:hypothetical protein